MALPYALFFCYFASEFGGCVFCVCVHCMHLFVCFLSFLSLFVSCFLFPFLLLLFLNQFNFVCSISSSWQFEKEAITKIMSVGDRH
jgi:hypothetical protein